MPFTTNNSTDPAREEGDEADWARWEQTFRDARPVLPEAAMARIEASIRAEADRVAARKPSNPRRRIFLLLALLVAVNLVVLLLLKFGPDLGVRHLAHSALVPPPVRVAATPPVEDHYPMDVPIGPNLVAPDAPVSQIEANLPWANGTGAMTSAKAPTTRPDALELVQAAEHLPADGHHALGLLELRRMAGVSAKLPPAFPPGIGEFRIGVCWRMLPLREGTGPQLQAALYTILDNAWTSRPGEPVSDETFWYDVLNDCLPANLRGQWAIPEGKGKTDPIDFPSHAADRARFDDLTELGFSKAQAALDVLTTRSYEPLTALQTMFASLPKEQANAYDAKLLPAAHDLFDRLFALRLAGRNAEADALVSSARKLRYLNDPQDMAVLLARLGPEDAWNKLLRPLMEDEANFVNNPPRFDEAAPRVMPDAIVQAPTKSTADGVATYGGPSVLISAGPWRITCNKLSVFHNTTHGVLLSGSGAVQVRGVIGYLGLTADEVTFNTETGEMKLAGRVHLDGWKEASDVNSCTVIRTGEVRFP